MTALSGRLRDKKCENCQRVYVGRGSSKYCLDCKVEIMEEQQRKYYQMKNSHSQE